MRIQPHERRVSIWYLRYGGSGNTRGREGQKDTLEDYFEL